MIVIDTNVLVDLLLLGPRTGQAEILRRQERQWAAPPLWRSEFRTVHSGCSTSNDCENVAAAKQLGVPLITEDGAILAAFPEVVPSRHQATS